MSTKIRTQTRIQKGRVRKSPRREAQSRTSVTLWEKIDALTDTIPASEWSNVPRDGSVNVDHYLYSAPKQTS